MCFRPKFEPQIRLPEPFFFFFCKFGPKSHFHFLKKKFLCYLVVFFQLGINSNEKIEKTEMKVESSSINFDSFLVRVKEILLKKKVSDEAMKQL